MPRYVIFPTQPYVYEHMVMPVLVVVNQRWISRLLLSLSLPSPLPSQSDTTWKGISCSLLPKTASQQSGIPVTGRGWGPSMATMELYGASMSAVSLQPFTDIFSLFTSEHVSRKLKGVRVFFADTFKSEYFRCRS